MPRTVGELLALATERLNDSSDSATIDAQVLLCHVMQCDRSQLYAWPEHVPDNRQQQAFADLLARRAAGHPIAHLTGEREFWSLSLAVDAHTLIPRPETEQLVEIALALDLADNARVLDLGTGSGAIAVALASQQPDWCITALDASPDALAVARRNVERLGIGNVTLLHSDWFSALPDGASFDLIVANPPYVASDDPHLTQGDVRFEPTGALVAGHDGLDDLRRIVSRSPSFLYHEGWLWLEHGAGQGEAVRELMRGRGFDAVATHSDLAGLARHTGGRWRADVLPPE